MHAVTYMQSACMSCIARAIARCYKKESLNHRGQLSLLAMASNVPKKRIKIKASGKLSESQQQELKNIFEEYGEVSNFEPCDTTTNLLTMDITDESGKCMHASMDI